MKLNDERGIVIVLALLLLLVVTLIGISATNITTYDILIAGNKRASEQALYAAEAGIHEFMGRFRDGATGEITYNNSSDKTNPSWRFFLALNAARAAAIGYNAADTSNHKFDASLQTPLDFAVEVRHKVNSLGDVIIFGTEPVYTAKGRGYTLDGGNKAIELEINKVPEPPAAVYGKDSGTIKVVGAHTYISGLDPCPIGGISKNKPGIMIANASGVIYIEGGGPVVNGTPDTLTDSSKKFSPEEIINYFERDADFRYRSEDNDMTLNGSAWGSPNFTAINLPMTYTGSMNIVYFDMKNDATHTLYTLRLDNDSHGGGILLVDGNLVLKDSGWYGIIVVTGTFKFNNTRDFNVTGSVFAGGDVDVGDKAGILYCSDAILKVKNRLPLRMVRWREVF